MAEWRDRSGSVVGYVLAGLLLSAAWAGPTSTTVVLEPIEAGPHAHVAERTFAVVTDADEFAALYQRIHAGRLPPPAAPKVDFEVHMVVAAFMGTRPSAGYGIALGNRATMLNGVVSVGFTETRPAPDTAQAAVETAPYAIAALPRGDYAAVRFVDVGAEVARIRLDASSGAP